MSTPTHNQKILHQLAHEGLAGPCGAHERAEALETLRVTWYPDCRRCPAILGISGDEARAAQRGRP